MKKILYVALLCIFFVPAIAFAQASIQDYLKGIALFLNSSVVPFIFALAFLFFLVNAVRYFIIGSTNEAAQEKARALALWGIIAFVLMISIWGIVNLLIKDLGFENYTPPCPDFLPASECE